MKSSMLIIFLLLITAISCSDEETVIKEKRTADRVDVPELTLITEKAAPNSYEENGELTGRAVEIVQAVLKEVEMEGLKIEVYPWARGYHMLETKKNIALFGTVRSEARENLFKWAGPISEYSINLYKLKSRKDIEPQSMEDLKKYVVGGVRKDQKAQYLASKGFTVSYANEDKLNIRKLMRGRIDILSYSPTRLNYDLKELGYTPDQLEKIWTLDELSCELAVAFSKSTEDHFVQKFQEGFDAIRKNGIQEEILKKWE